MLTAASNLPHPADQRKPKPEPYQLLPEVPPEQFEALKADIGKRGVIVPVLLDEYGTIIDGHNRARACREFRGNAFNGGTRISDQFKANWAAFLAKNSDRQLSDVMKELETLQHWFNQHRSELRPRRKHNKAEAAE
jgi:ParB-like nuclease family protein